MKHSVPLLFLLVVFQAGCDKPISYYTYEFTGSNSSDVARQIGQLRQGLPAYYENVIAEATNVANGWTPAPTTPADYPANPC